MEHPSIEGSPPPDARPLWSGARPSSRQARRLCEAAASASAAAFAVPVGELYAATRRSPYVALARQSAMYLSHTAFGLTLHDVATAFGRDRTTAAHACRLIEDRRDDPAVDMLLGSLEDACRALRHRLTAPVTP